MRKTLKDDRMERDLQKMERLQKQSDILKFARMKIDKQLLEIELERKRMRLNIEK